ncbi:MAG: DoxX family protein [Acidimicrobiia bacterium]|nr:DoxX family protein [Acidimicrobiia bacterium]
MNKALWVAQILAGIFFLYVGVLHFIVPEGLPSTFSWMYDLSDVMHYISGTLEILGGLGLILPAVTRIQPQLVPVAAGGLALLMLSAVIFHIGRGEYGNVGSNVLWIIVTAFIAYGRTKVAPLQPRTASA